MTASEPQAEPQEIAFEAEGLRYAGLVWGRPEQPVIIALHGWMDNALSFHRLAPLLSDYRVIALDLSGHGHTDHRSTDATYHLWDELPALVAIVDQLGVETVTVLGHSRGASIAAMLAAVLGERCRRMVVIDGLLLAYNDDRHGGQQLKQFVSQRQKYTGRGERYFESVDDFVERRRQYGFSDQSALDLAPRALEATAEGFRLRADPRLFSASALWPSPRLRGEIYEEIQAPVLAIIAGEGLFNREAVARRMLEEAGASIGDFRSVTIPGSHHLHMEESAVSQVAQRMHQFLVTGE